MASLQDLLDLLFEPSCTRFRRHDGLSDKDHALQCATLAARAQASESLITACFFHDIGHLLYGRSHDPLSQGINNRHEERALPYLKTLFSKAVTEPIRLHVNAKRYLCAIDPSYWDDLPPRSRTSLALQGGPFSESDAIAFINQPYAKDAVQLRIWDDLAHNPRLDTFVLSDLLPIIAASQRTLCPVG